MKYPVMPVVWGFLGAGMLALGFFAAATVGETWNDQAKARGAEDARFNRAYGGVMTIRNEMRDPASLRFSRALVMDGGGVCYEFRARNSFGGMDVSSAVLSGSRVYLAEKEGSAFAIFHEKECKGKMGIDEADDINKVLKDKAE